MKHVTIAAALTALVILAGTEARAQYNYPGGYGGYGWGGWGSTVQGSIASGLGYFNMGRGLYNLDTAQAASINTDTIQRWNQYVFQSQQEANKRYSARQKGELARVNTAQAKIHDRLRNHPETLDITDGDALNEILVTLLNPGVSGSGLRSISTPIRPELIQDIPFELASEGMTICLSQMTQMERWPLALSVDALAPERAAVTTTIAGALAEDEAGTIKPKTIQAVQTAIDALERKFASTVPKDSPDYVPAEQHIKAIAGITRMLYSPKVEEILAELEDYQGTTLGELLSFMQAFNLRFAAANSFRQRRIYLKLYPLLAAVADGAPGTPPVAAVEHAASGAVQAAENAGKSVYDGLANAATDLFKDMDWKHLSPKPPAPAQP